MSATKLRGSVESSDWSRATWTTRQGCPEGERGGVHQFYTPKCGVNLNAEMIEPYKGKIYDPCCGSGGSLPASRPCGVRFVDRNRAPALGIVQSLKFVESHHSNTKDISVYGQDKWARGAHLGRAKRARRVRQRRKLPNQMTSTTCKQAKMNESAKLDEIITENLAELGFSKR